MDYLRQKRSTEVVRAFWCTGPLGLVQHEDFWDTLAKNISVYRNDITSLKSSTVTLDDGTELAADAILCGTGWKSSYPFFDEAKSLALGLPHTPESSSEEDKLWESLLESADEQVLKEYPLLADPPQYSKPNKTTNIRLYNCIAPLDDPTVVFLGRAHLSNSFRMAEAQAIWATAYLDGSISLPPKDQARREIAAMNAVSRRRYPSQGAAGDYIFFELVAYTDVLLQQVGIQSHRKSGWWADLVEPCLTADFKTAKDEYKKLHKF